MKDLVAFLGPSLPRGEARKVAKGVRLLPPARQGDVFKVLATRPRAIALIDGVFEGAPSVWHHELIAAHNAGVTVLGASSMGALRAAELPGVVTPVGLIARRYVEGAWNDDAWVALLHADEASGFRPLTEPHVNVIATAELAVRRRVLSEKRAQALVTISASQFYQSRTWYTVLSALDGPEDEKARLRAFVRAKAVNQKAADAVACLKQLVRAPARAAARASSFSSFVRRSRLIVPPVRDAARAQLEDAGTRTLLIASFARVAGLVPLPERTQWWFDRLPPDGWADDERATAAESLALEEMVLSAPEYFVADGPARVEGLVLAHQRGRVKEAKK